MTLIDIGTDIDGALLVFHDLRRESERGVEGDVAVHEPGAGVVGLEGDNHVAAVGQQDDVAAGRVVVG